MSDIVNKSNEKNLGNTTKKKWKRKCPKCNKLLSYCDEIHLNRAIKEKRKCKLCAMKIAGGKRRKYFHKKLKKKCPICNKVVKFSTIYKYNTSTKNNSCCFSCSKKGKNNPMFGVVGVNNPCYRIKRPKEFGIKIRLSKINRLKKLGIIDRPTYNQKACQFIDKLNVRRKWNLQHAMNGGEICIAGYWVDGYDKDKNIAFEYDERYHYLTGKLRPKDLKRMNEIKSTIKCKFYRYNENTKELKCY